MPKNPFLLPRNPRAVPRIAASFFPFLSRTFPDVFTLQLAAEDVRQRRAGLRLLRCDTARRGHR